MYIFKNFLKNRDVVLELSKTVVCYVKDGFVIELVCCTGQEKYKMSRELKKIVLIGPVYPYKGGISHYTGLMYKILRSKYDTKMISYKMQYPKILFKKEQKDYENDSFKIDETDFAINTANPFNWIKTANHIKKENPDLVIIQWWHPYFSPCYWSICRLLGKIKVLFLCHNVFPHERFPMDRFLAKHVLLSGDCYITQSRMDAEDLKSIKPDAKYIQTVHPTYNAFKFKDMSREEARQILHLQMSEKVLLFFGFVREYKGLKHLLRAMAVLKEDGLDTKLLIVGDFGEDKQSYLNLIDELGIADMLEIHDGYIPDKEVEKYFAASDLVVLPYESATQSGIVQIAYGFEKPVVVTDVGGLPDVVVDGKTGYVVESEKPDAISQAVAKYFREDNAEEFGEHIREEAYKYSWDRMLEVIEKLYKE